MPLELCNLKTDGLMSKQAIDINFDDLHCAFDSGQAQIAAARCLYCYDAPCINACPTSIDVPTFIHQIRTDNLLGSAKTILSQNILGGTCARACPTEVLCEQACVLNGSQHQPVEIGRLQRFAVDHLLNKKQAHPFKRAMSSGKHLAIIGAGPAGLSCAHRSAMLGQQVTIFEAKDKPGGLNEYGLAAYKMADDFAQREIKFLLQIGGITIEYGQRLGRELSLDVLLKTYDAVFVSVGLNKSNQLPINKHGNPDVIDAIEFIEKIRQTKDKSSLKVGNDVIVIGAGNTAIDAAIQTKRLGAENVTLVYRRGEASMNATQFEIDLARQNGVNFRFWSAPKSFLYSEQLTAMEFERTQVENGQLITCGKVYSMAVDKVLIAIGQSLDGDQLTASDTPSDLAHLPKITQGKFLINDDFTTSITGVFAGGDCVKTGDDLTVQAVEDGKQAAHSIDRYLSNMNAEGS